MINNQLLFYKNNTLVFKVWIKNKEKLKGYKDALKAVNLKAYGF